MDIKVLNVLTTITETTRDAPGLFRHDKQRNPTGPVIYSSWFWSYANGLQKRAGLFEELFDIPIETQNKSRYAILQRASRMAFKRDEYLKYPDNKYYRVQKRQVTQEFDGIQQEMQKYINFQEVTREELPMDIQSREDDRTAIYESRKTERYREEDVPLKYGRVGQVYKRIFIDDKCVCAIETWPKPTTDTYCVIWPDGQTERWNVGIFFSHEEDSGHLVSDLFPAEVLVAGKEVGCTGASMHALLRQLDALK